MTKRTAITLTILLLAGALLAPTAGEQYGAGAWRILKTMMGSYLCTEASLCMFGQGIFYVDSIAEAQTALDDGCGEDLSGSTQSGCIIQFEKGLFSNVINGSATTLSMAGTGSGDTGRAGVIIRGVGFGGAKDASGNPISGTILKSGGAVPVIDVGSCNGCMIENLTIAGEESATVGVDFLPPAVGYPTTRFVMRNVSMYEINGPGIRTATSGQIDTMIFENISVRDSDACFQQRDSQSVGIILSNFDCSTPTSSGPMFDIQEGDFTYLNGFLAIKNNETGFAFGKPVGKVIIRGNQLEMGPSTTATLFDFNAGAETQQSNVIIDANHIQFSANGNTLFDVLRRGTFTVSNNEWQNTSGNNTTVSTFAADTGGTSGTTNNRLFLTLFGNSNVENDAGDAQKPERWIPTLSGGPPAITLLTPIISGPDSAKVSPCIDGELFNDSDAGAGTNGLVKCLSGAWVAL